MSNKIDIFKDQIIDFVNSSPRTKKDISEFIKGLTGLGRSQCFYWANKFYIKKESESEEVFDNEMLKSNPFTELQDDDFSSDTKIIEMSGNDVRSLEDLISACNIDLNEWHVDKFTCNKWDGYKKVKLNGSIVVQPNPSYQIKASFVRKYPFDKDKFLNIFKEEAQKLSPKFDKIKPHESKGEYLYVPSCPDLHAGKLVWHGESGQQDYNLDIACDLFSEAIYNLVNKVDLKQVKTILLPIGNDLFNVDTPQYTTTKGTPQMDSHVWQESFEKVFKLIKNITLDLSSKANVILQFVSGNHDYTKVYYLGHSLNSFFVNHPNVFVNNDKTARKYIRFGKVLLGFTHGNNEKIVNLPNIMAHERKEDWGQTCFREYLLGHWHHVDVKEIGGVKIRILPSLCPADLWHANKGYVTSQKGAEGLLYHENEGLVTQHYFNVQ